MMFVSCRHVRTKKKDADESDESDLDDEEVSLGSMDEDDFGDELEDEGGTFMDPDDDDEGGWSQCDLFTVSSSRS